MTCGSIIAFAAFVWAGGLGATLMILPFGEPAHKIVWWPITLFKFLVRTLWLSLTTEWKP